MSRLSLLPLLLAVATVAHADELPPADGSPTAPVSAPPHDAGDDGWGGAQPDRVRGLPECAPGEPPPGPGEAYRCRPRIMPGPVQWSLEVDWTTGVVDGPPSLLGGTSGLGVAVGFALTRWLTVGPRYQLLGFGRGVPAGAAEAAGAVAAHDVLGQARLRLFTDEVDRDAWALSAGAGWSFRSAALGSGPVARIALIREGGMYVTGGAALTTGLELAYQQSLDDAGLRMVTASVRGGLEVGIRAPRNLDEVEPGPPFRYSVAGEWRIGSMFGFGLTFGKPITDHVALRLTVDHSLGRDGATLQGFDGASWGVLGGFRVMPASWVALPYLEAQAGWDWTAGQDDLGRPSDGAGRGDLEVGVRLGLGCGGAVDLGARVRGRLGVDDEAFAPRDGALVLRLELGEGARVLRSAATGACGRAAPTRPSAVVYPEPPVPPPPPIPPDPGGHLGVAVGGELVAEVEPIVIEVELGAVLFGGAVQVRLDPRLLPLERLRAAGFIEIELIGPAAGLARFDAGLRGVLSRRGLVVQGWTRTITDASVVRARFTLWPAGARRR